VVLKIFSNSQERFLNPSAIFQFLLKNQKWLFEAKKELNFGHFGLKWLKNK